MRYQHHDESQLGYHVLSTVVRYTTRLETIPPSQSRGLSLRSTVPPARTSKAAYGVMAMAMANATTARRAVPLGCAFEMLPRELISVSEPAWRSTNGFACPVVGQHRKHSSILLRSSCPTLLDWDSILAVLCLCRMCRRLPEQEPGAYHVAILSSNNRCIINALSDRHTHNEHITHKAMRWSME